jgi:hypothetical protein
MEVSPVIDNLRQLDVESARRQTFEQKFMAGAELFDYACTIAIGGIRSQHPDFNEEQVRAELRRRLEIGRRIESRG